MKKIRKNQRSVNMRKRNGLKVGLGVKTLHSAGNHNDILIFDVHIGFNSREESEWEHSLLV